MQVGKSGGDAANAGFAAGGDAGAGAGASADAIAVPLDPSHADASADANAMGGGAMDASGGDASDNTSVGSVNINS